MRIGLPAYLRILAVGILLSTATVLSQATPVTREGRHAGTPVLWREHRNPAALDLYWGPGGPRMRPDLRKLTFIEEEKGSYSTKYRVRDAAGRVWIVKVGKEAQSETASTRLLWAAGYMTETVYLAPVATIPGNGTFRNVRFEAGERGARGRVEVGRQPLQRDAPVPGTKSYDGRPEQLGHQGLEQRPPRHAGGNCATPSATLARRSATRASGLCSGASPEAATTRRILVATRLSTRSRTTGALTSSFPARSEGCSTTSWSRRPGGREGCLRA
jgi:hypothetical protein